MKKVNEAKFTNTEAAAKDFDFKAGIYNVPGTIFRTGGVTIDESATYNVTYYNYNFNSKDSTVTIHND